MNTDQVAPDFSNGFPIASDDLSLTDGQDYGSQGAVSDAAPQKQAPKQAAHANSGDPRFFAPSGTSSPFFAPPPGATTSPGSAGRNPLALGLGLSLNFAVQQDPNHYAKLLQIQKQTTIPPVVSAGNETQIQQYLDANRIDPQAFVIASPRTAGFFSDPISAAVAGVHEIQRQADIEKHAAVMRSSTDGFSAYTPTSWEKAVLNLRQATKFVTGKTTNDLVQSLYENPLTRLAIATVGGTVGQVGDLGSMAGWHGDGPTRENLFQRTETGLKPETVFAGDPIQQYAYYAHTNGLDVAAPIVAGFMTGLGEEKLVALGLSSSGLSANAIKVASRLAVALTFAAESGGQAYTRTAAASGSDDDARSAADRTFAINLPANFAAGFADKIPWLNKFPVLASALAGGFVGGSAQLANNLVDGRPWNADLLSQAGKSAAMQAGLHFGFGMLPGETPGIAARPGTPAEFAAELAASPYLNSLADAVETAKGSKLKERAPDRFYAANQVNFEGDPNLRIAQEPSSSQPIEQGADTAEVAQASGSASPVDAARPGGEAHVSMPHFLSAEHGKQTAALPDVIAPGIDLSARELRDGRVELQQWQASGGLDRLQAVLEQTDPETAATPEWQNLQGDLRQRYTDAGVASAAAATLSVRGANVFSNLARLARMSPDEMLESYDRMRGGQDAEKAATEQSSGVDGPSKTKMFDTTGTAASVEDKLLRYVLNSEHPKGGPKAAWFKRALGFDRSNLDDLASQIKFDPKTAFETGKVDEHGTRYNQIISVIGANGKVIPVRFGWNKRPLTNAIEFSTAIPTERSK